MKLKELKCSKCADREIFTRYCPVCGTMRPNWFKRLFAGERMMDVKYNRFSGEKMMYTLFTGWKRI